MNAPALLPPHVERARRDAIAVAACIDSSWRVALAGALAWRAAEDTGAPVDVCAAALGAELAAIGMPLDVPVLSEAPSGLAERYRLEWRVWGMFVDQRVAYRGVLFERLSGGRWRLELGSRYRTVELAGVERAAFEMLEAAGALGAEPLDGLVRRVREIRAGMNAAEAG